MKIDRSDLAGVLAASTATPQWQRNQGSSHLKLNGREVARDNDLCVMKMVMFYGHIRFIELGRAVWPKAAFAEQMGRRTAKRLVTQGLLLERRNALGSTSLCVTRAGAAWLEARGIDAHHTLDLSSVSGPTFFHRTLATRFLIERQIDGDNVAGEYQIYRGQLPFSIAVLVRVMRKMPDGLVWRRRHDGKIHVYWVEQESSIKARPDIERCLQAARHVGTTLTPDGMVVLAGLLFVFDCSMSHAKRIRLAASTLWGSLPVSERVALEQKVKLVSVEILPPLVWVSHRETTLADYRLNGKV